jgi:hypothetical protein
MNEKLFREKNIKLLEMIHNNPDKPIMYYSQLLRSSYSHIFEVTNNLIKDGIILVKPSGKGSMLRLAKKGEDLFLFLRDWQKR